MRVQEITFPCTHYASQNAAEDGKKLQDSGKGIQTEYGLLFVNMEIEFSDIFGILFSALGL